MKTEASFRDLGIVVIGLTMLSLVFWGLESRKMFKCFIMGHTSRGMEDSGAEYDSMNCEN